MESSANELKLMISKVSRNIDKDYKLNKIDLSVIYSFLCEYLTIKTEKINISPKCLSKSEIDNFRKEWVSTNSRNIEVVPEEYNCNSETARN